MALSPHQQANPHRPISGRNYQTYLERSFSEARLDEMAYWLRAGVVARTLTAPRHAPSFMRAAVDGLAHGDISPDVRLDWLTRLWEIGAHGMGKAEQERWLDRLVTVPDMAEFLLGKGVSPHAPIYRHAGVSTSACVNLLDTLLRVEHTAEQRRPSGDAIERAWAHLDRVWAVEGWAPTQRSKALSLLTWRAMYVDDERMMCKLETLRDRLTGPDANPLDSESGGAPSAMNRWLHTWNNGGRDNLADAKLHWGLALLGTPPTSPKTTLGDLYFWGDVAATPECTALVDALAGWGRLPWHISKAERAVRTDRSDVPRQTVMSLWSGTRNENKSLSLAHLPTWLACLERTALRYGFPDPEWQEVATRDWTAYFDTLGPRDSLASDEEWSSWIEGLKTLSRLGRWPETGCSVAVSKILHGLAQTPRILSCPDERLKELTEVARAAGVLPQAILPSELFEKGPNREPERGAWERKKWKFSHKWLAFKRWCSSPTLFYDLMKALPDEPGRLHDALVLMADAVVAGPSFETPSAVEGTMRQRVMEACPDWLPGRGQLLFQELMAAGNVEEAGVLAKIVPTPLDASQVWKAWSTGAVNRPVLEPLTPSCPWMGLARFLIEKGVDPNQGDPSWLPLATVAGHARGVDAVASIQWLIDHGAQPEKAIPREAQTPAYQVWASTKEALVLSRALDEAQPPPRGRLRL